MLRAGENGRHCVNRSRPPRRRVGGQAPGASIVVSEKDGHLRASLHIYNNDEDMDGLLYALLTA